MVRGALGRAKGMPEVIFANFLNAAENRWQKTCKQQGQCCTFAVGEVEGILSQGYCQEEDLGKKNMEVLQRPLQNVRTPAARYSHVRCKMFARPVQTLLARLTVPVGSLGCT